MIRYGVVQDKVADEQKEKQPDTQVAPREEESDTDSKTTSSEIKETDK